MKKLLILLTALLLTTGFAFAQEEVTQTEVQQNQAETQNQSEPEATATEEKKKRSIELFNLEINLGFPVHWTNGLHDDWYPANIAYGAELMEDKSVTANTAMGISVTFNFTRIIGLTLDADLFFGGKLAGFASPTSDHNSLTGANVMLGPIFYLYNNNVLRIPLAIGPHMYFFKDDLWVPDINGSQGAWLNRSDLQIGLTVSLGIQYHFTKNIYMFARTSVALDFVRFHKIKWLDTSSGTGEYKNDSHSDIFVNLNWGVKPSIGLGIKK